jgi:hypothetical protein
VGRISDTGASVCDACALGKFQPSVAQASCSPCAPGEYAGTVGKANCDKCPAGSQSGNLGGASVCTPCVPGKHRFVPLAASWMLSARRIAGKYASLPGTDVCTLCPSGMQQDQSGRDLCTNCLDG